MVVSLTNTVKQRLKIHKSGKPRYNKSSRWLCSSVGVSFLGRIVSGENQSYFKGIRLISACQVTIWIPRHVPVALLYFVPAYRAYPESGELFVKVMVKEIRRFKRAFPAIASIGAELTWLKTRLRSSWQTRPRDERSVCLWGM